MANPLRVLHDAYLIGRRVKPRGKLFGLVAAMAVPLTLFEIWVGFFGRIQPLTLGMVFVMPMYTISFLVVSRTPNHDRPDIFDYLLSAASLICSTYLLFNVDRYVEWIAGLHEFGLADRIVALAMLALSLELLRRCVGLGLSMVVYALLAYVFFGHHLGGMFTHRPIGLLEYSELMIISQAGGIFGLPLQVAAGYAFLFILFGKIIEAIGGGKFFFDLAAAVAGRKVGGVAKVAVVSSGLFGTISGSPAADVMTTGAVTIPAMKRLGYPARFAGAVEAVASTGGSLLPPVMGAVAFLMAEFTGTQYLDIAAAAAFIALLYYFSVYYQVHLRSLKMGFSGLADDQIVGFRRAFLDGWQNIVPFAVLVYYLVQGYTAGYAAATGVAAAFAISWIRPGTRIAARRFVKIAVETCCALAPLVSAVAAAGLVIGCLHVTGVPGKISAVIFSVTGGEKLIALIIAMATTLILGMGMPTVAAYALVAVLIAPALVKMGFPLFEVHLFLVYYAVLSAITPPIAVACYVASSIAEAGPMEIARQAVRLGLVAFLIPFMFVYHPALLLRADLPDIAIAMVSATLGVYFLAIGLEGWLRAALNWWQRALFLGAGFLTLYPGLATDAAGIVAGGALVLLLRTRNLSREASG